MRWARFDVGTIGSMEPAADRFRAILLDPDPRLDLVLAAVASLARPAPSEDEVIASLDDLARSAPGPSADAVVAHLFGAGPGSIGLVGNTVDYYDPDNSFVHRVLATGRGIPISLAAIAHEVGRRRGTALTIVGLPGHVVIGDGDAPHRWFDPFAGGAELDLAGCEALVSRLHPSLRFEERLTRPIATPAVAYRMLNNLKAIYRQRGELDRLEATLALQVEVPGGALTDRLDLVRVQLALGRHDRAVDGLEALVELDPTRAETYQAEARRYRAHRN